MNVTLSSSFSEIVSDLLANPQDREQYEALLAARETARNESHAAGNLATVSEHDVEIEKIKTDLAAAHAAEIARLTDERNAALDSQKIASDTAFEALRVQLLEKHDAEMQAAADELAKDRESRDAIANNLRVAAEDAQTQVEALKKDRDTLKATLATEEARQDQLAAAANSFADALVALAGQGKALADEAGKKLADKQAEDAKAEVEKLRALLAEKEARL